MDQPITSVIVTPIDKSENTVPAVNPNYVPFGHYSALERIITSGQFIPTCVTGLSGNGKTSMFEQICAQNKRGLVRMNITAETAEDDVFGGFRIINGTMVFIPGPALVAMVRGDVLLLDEFDQGTEKMMVMQPVLEGKAVYVKKIMKYFEPARGFNIVATANTKGAGERSEFIGARIQNEAYLDRFAFWFEQDYPSRSDEIKILARTLRSMGIPASKQPETDDFMNILVKWSETIRDTNKNGGAFDQMLTTRRLLDICKGYALFDCNRKIAVDLALARFSPETAHAFLGLYRGLDPTYDNISVPSGAAKAAAAKTVGV